eukprot:GDKJ01018641.1.p1 GENE.GDKJ01018641.1~~GDKJ01018641.1.p1  ORF type:complete len:1137 (+),score=285.90 GDKJ01018641.1:1-3411(+)
MGNPRMSGVGRFGPAQIRNICIVAHVDHGKTTLSDHLISTNGFIAQSTAGKIRFLDSREDEQEREITMKTSVISLFHKTSENEEYLINLMDSPGHIDFSTEVTTAVRLCDGAIVVIDAIEGVRSQTRTVLLQAWRERLRLIVFVNKVDKLFAIYEPAEAAAHLERVMEDLNLCLQQHYSADLMAKDNAEHEGAALAFDDALEKVYTMDPAEGKVLFGSALHGWAFEVATFASMAAKKLSPILAPPGQELAPEKVQKLMWGPRFLDLKNKKIVSKPPTVAALGESQASNLFAQLVLNPLYKIHQAVESGNVDEIKRVAQLTLVSQQQKDVFNNEIRVALAQGVAKDAQAQASMIAVALLKGWMPLTSAVIRAVVSHLPSPLAAAPLRLPYLSPSTPIEKLMGSPLWTCDPSAPATIYLARFLSADLDKLCLLSDRLIGQEKSGGFVAIARVFAGSIKPGTRLFVIRDAATTAEGKEVTSPKRANQVVTEEREVVGVYRMLGRDLRIANGCSAGDIVAVALNAVASRQVEEVEETRPCSPESHDAEEEAGEADQEGTDDEQDKSFEARHNASTSLRTMQLVERCLTLSQDASTPPLINPYLRTQGASLLKVTLDPINLEDLPKLMAGVKLLQRADPAASVSKGERGQIVIGCCGEVHLERCISALQRLYALVPFNASAPLIVVRETLARESIAREIALIAQNNGVVGDWTKTSDGEQAMDEKGDFMTDALLENVMEGRAKSTLNVAFPPWSNNSNINVDGDSHQREKKTVGVGRFSLFGDKLEIEVVAFRLNDDVVDFMDANVDNLLLLRANRGRSQVKFTVKNEKGENSICETRGVTAVTSVVKNLLKLKDVSLWSYNVSNEARTLLLAHNSQSIIFNSEENDSAVSPANVAPVSEWSLLDTLDSTTPLNSRLLGGWIDPLTKAFDAVSKSGPLASEALRGVAFMITRVAARSAHVSLADLYRDRASIQLDNFGYMLSSAREALVGSLMRPGLCRLMEAVLALEVECEQDMLGRTYGELSRRRSVIVDEELKGGSTSFLIKALIPMSESIGLAQGLRNSSKGQVLMHAEFHGWRVLNEDLFPEACMNEDQLEEWGEVGRPHNFARKLLLAIRKRKGLPTGEKIVIAGEKQRTLSRKV